jgi:hypothetical protein
MRNFDARQRFAESLTRVEIRPQVVMVSGQQLAQIRIQTAKHPSLGFIQRVDGPELAMQLLQIATKLLTIDVALVLLLAHSSLCSRGCGDVVCGQTHYIFWIVIVTMTTDPVVRLYDTQKPWLS